MTAGRDTTAGMDAQDAMRKLMIDDTFVNTAVNGRIYSEYAPQKSALPYIVMERVTAEHENHLLGSGGLVQPDIQLDIYAKSKTSRDELRKNIRAVLDGFRGNVTIDADTLFLQRLQLVNDLTDLVQPDDGSDRQIWRGSLDFEVGHVEAQPTF
jgi:hypothetical protein